MSTVLSDVIGRGTLAARPAAGVAGRLYFDTTNTKLTRDNGSTWDDVAETTAGSGSITASGYTQNTARLLGRTTASAGAIEEITVGSGLSLSAGSLTASTAAPTAHACQAQRASTNFAVGNNTFTAVQWDAEVFDTDTMHDNSTNNSRITIPTITGVTTGLWRIYAHGYTNASSGRADTMFRKNANAVNSGGTFINTVTGWPVVTVVSFMFATDAVLSAGDYVECFVRTTGGNFSVVYDATAVPTFGVVFLGLVT